MAAVGHGERKITCFRMSASNLRGSWVRRTSEETGEADEDRAEIAGRGGDVRRGLGGESGDETRLGERGGMKAMRKVVGRLRNEMVGIRKGASEPRSSSATNIAAAPLAAPLIKAGMAEHVNYSQIIYSAVSASSGKRKSNPEKKNVNERAFAWEMEAGSLPSLPATLTLGCEKPITSPPRLLIPRRRRVASGRDDMNGVFAVENERC